MWFLKTARSDRSEGNVVEGREVLTVGALIRGR